MVAGATGYVGGRLVPRLLQAGYRVRCLVRRPTNLRQQLLRPLVECVPGDVLRPETLPAAMEGVDTVYYLIHSMESGKDFEEQDLVAARQCAKAAKAQNNLSRRPRRSSREAFGASPFAFTLAPDTNNTDLNTGAIFPTPACADRFRITRRL